jgi:hypothetical protein
MAGGTSSCAGGSAGDRALLDEHGPFGALRVTLRSGGRTFGSLLLLHTAEMSSSPSPRTSCARR